jgi:acetyl-CoA acetyltransferase
MKKKDAAIVGVGFTEYSSNSGRSVLSLAVESCQKAMDDAGLTPQDVDGVLEFNIGDSVPSEAIATGVALPQISYILDWYAGGFAPSALVATAAMAVNSGMAKAVLVCRAMNGRSGMRLGGTEQAAFLQLQSKAGGQYRSPYGFLTFAQGMAMWCRRHMVEYGTKPEHLGAIAISQRANAILNERAMQRKPLTMDDYMASRMIVEPFRLFDMCLESDGSCALLVTSANRAKDCKKKPVFIKAAGFAGGPGVDWDPGFANIFSWQDVTENFTKPLSQKLYREAGLGPNDIDIAEIYDCFTHTVLLGLEGLGFCPKGEGGPFAASGAIGLHGSIPVNTHGGMLSEAYIHGMNVIAEAVMQLRGEGGARQVSDAEVAIVTSGAQAMGSGLILTV